jgi:hypothetical protein
MVRFQSFSDKACWVRKRLKFYPRVSDISLSGTFSSVLFYFSLNTLVLFTFHRAFTHYYNQFLSPTSILECNSHKIKIHVYFLSEHFEFRHFRPHYLDVVNMVFLTTRLLTADVNIHASNRQIWYRHPNSEAGNDEIQNVQRESKHVNSEFLCFNCNIYFAPLWRMGPRCSSAETKVCHRRYIIAAS